MPKVKGKSVRCPTCNHTIAGHDYTKSIEKRRLARDVKTLELVDETISRINSSFHEPLDDLDIYSFYSGIEGVQDIVVRKMVREYLLKKMYSEGKNIRYLIAMIKNENSTYGVRVESEKKRLDRLPPKVD